MSSTYLVGYYGMQNSGDDALLLASAWGARQFVGAGKLIVNSPCDLNIRGHGKYPAILRSKQQFPSQNRFRQYRAAVNASRVIFGGGSVFQNARDINIKRHLMMLSKARHHMAVGVGLGPFENVRAERACAHFLNNCAYVGVRDSESKAIADAIAPQANVEQTFDLAPSLLAMPDFSVLDLPRKGIAVCLCPQERLTGNRQAENSRLAALAKSLDLVHSLTGETIYFVDFNGHPELGDRAVHNDVAALMDPSTRKKFTEYDPNPLRLIQQMGTYKVAVCMRLHASVMAFMSNTPVISLNYHPKCDGWCEQIGIPEAYRLNAGHVSAKVITDLLCSGFADGFLQSAMQPVQASQLAMKNWRNSYVYEQSQNNRHYSLV